MRPRPPTHRGAALRAFAGALGLLLATAGAPTGAQEPPDEAVVADLPFLDRGPPGAVHVDLAEDDALRRLPLQLDTGAASSLVTPGLARELGIRVRDSKRTPYRRATRLGRDLELYVRERPGEAAAREGFGLLGGNFLGHYVVEIDWARRRVRFLDPDRFQVPEESGEEGAVVLPARMQGRRPVVELELQGRPLPVLLDTGASFGVLLGREVAREHGIRSDEAPGLTAVGVDGTIPVEFTRLADVAFGPLRYRDVPAVVAPRGLRQHGPANDSLIGQDLLATCLLRIDYPRGRVWLRRRPGVRPRFLGADWSQVRESGAVLYRSGDVVFAGVVLPGSPAAARGLAPGDVLVEARADAEDFDPTRPHAWIASADPLSVRRLDARGRAHTVVLEAAVDPTAEASDARTPQPEAPRSGAGAEPEALPPADAEDAVPVRPDAARYPFAVAPEGGDEAP